MNDKNMLKTIIAAVVLIFAGAVFIMYNSWFGYTDSAILYLAAIVGAGCYWVGINKNN